MESVFRRGYHFGIEMEGLNESRLSRLICCENIMSYDTKENTIPVVPQSIKKNYLFQYGSSMAYTLSITMYFEIDGS